MADDKLKQEFLYMASLTSKYDFHRMEVVEGILRLENERRILDSVFGRRFKTRIFDIAAGVATDEKCVLCGMPADNRVICNHCMETILGSDYAKNKIKIKEKKINVKECSKYVAVVCLILILFIQIWLLYLLHTIPDRNPTVEPKVSSTEPSAVSDKDSALMELKKEFPEEEGYEITFVREDYDNVGRFLLENGACCAEVEENLSDEERYDYFFTEPVYVFYISNIEQYSARIGIAEINQSGSILLLGKFNDGRRIDSFYKYR